MAILWSLMILFSCASGYNERADTYYEEGLLFFERMEYDQSIESFTKVLKLAPYGEQNHLVYYNRGMAYFRNRQYEKAVYDFTKAMEMAPPNDSRFVLKAAEWRGNAYQKSNEAKRAIEDYTAALKLGPDDENAKNIYNNRAWCFYSQAAYDAAIDDFNRAIDIDSEYDPAYYGRAVVWLKKEDFQRAMIDAKEALRLSPSSKQYDDLLHEVKTAMEPK
jgi:tetratricopeptide (TPR) repeat protein